jgi:dienelactone hydrolase
MARIPRFVRMAAVGCVAGTSALACGGGGDEGGLTVTSEVVSDPTAPDVRVLAPEGKGTWPVVMALHGLEGSGEDMVELATRIARAGAVVFVPSYHSEFSTMEDLIRAGDDISCAYRLARRTASDYGGDLTQPVTAVGWSLGAGYVLLGSLRESGDETDAGRCPGPVPRPDVVVGISGCYYDFPVSWLDDETSWGNNDADIHLIDGDRDDVCPRWQTEKLSAALRTAGYHVELVQLSAANHYVPVFHDWRNGQWQVIKDDPAGERTVQVILDAIAAARDTPPAD